MVYVAQNEDIDRRTALAAHYRNKQATILGSQYKQHYRQMAMLVEDGRTVAGGHTIYLRREMLEDLWDIYQTEQQYA